MFYIIGSQVGEGSAGVPAQVCRRPDNYIGKHRAVGRRSKEMHLCAVREGFQEEVVCGRQVSSGTAACTRPSAHLHHNPDHHG